MLYETSGSAVVQCYSRMLDSRPRGCGLEPHRHHCVVSLSKNINHSLVLVQPRKTPPFITERLLMERKESYQTNKTSEPKPEPDSLAEGENDDVQNFQKIL